MYSDGPRPITPEGSIAYTNSPPSSPNKPLSARDKTSDEAGDLGAGLSVGLSPKASLALDEVIRELEEEGDDEIVMERSPIAAVPNNYIPTLPPMVRLGFIPGIVASLTLPFPSRLNHRPLRRHSQAQRTRRE